MTFAELKAELAARGFDYLTNARQGQFVNRAYQELCAEEDWPFLEATTSGTAPLTISDLRTIESVVDSTNRVRLRPLDRRNIMDYDQDLTTSGTPVYYYLTAGTVLNTYPVSSTNTIAVRYWKVPAQLSTDGENPVVPLSWHQAIVDGAVMYAYQDSDNFEAASAMRDVWSEIKIRMQDALLNQQHDGADDFIQILSGSEDWGDVVL